jgi:aquaporin Z
MVPLPKRMTAEVFGTFWLVFGGCGSAVLAANQTVAVSGYPVGIGIGYLGVALAFGLTVLTMAYAIGHISGCHLNPAVTTGLCVAGRFPVRDVIPYWFAQCLGGLGGAAVLYYIASGNGHGGLSIITDPVKAPPGQFATNGYDALSPGSYLLVPCLLTEFVLTMFFLLIILGATDWRAPIGFAPIPVGLGLTLIHLVGIPVTNLSVNPARSTGPAVILRLTDKFSEPLNQLWLFWAAPLAGAVAAGVLYRWFWDEKKPVAVP